MAKTEFGVRLPVSGPLASAGAIATVVKAAEKMGFDSAWARDNLQWDDHQNRTHVSEGAVEAFPAKKDPDTFEVNTTLAYAAALTNRIKLGSSVVTIHPRRDPLILAKQAAMLDVLSNGRYIMGLGVTPWLNQWKAFDIENYFKVRYRFFAEAVEAMKMIWTQPYASFNGKYVRFNDVCFYPKPVQRPHMPLWYGGFSEGCYKRVAAHCTGWLAATDRSPDQIKLGIDKILEHAKKRGRSDKEFTFAAEIHLCISKSKEDARRKAQKTVSEFLKDPLSTPGGMPLEDILGRTLVGSPSEIIKMMERYKDVGVSHFEYKPIYMSIDDMLQQMQMIVDEVMPSFR